MQNKNERRAAVRFSAAKFKRLPMAEKLAYLRSAFGALGNGLHVVEVPVRKRRPAPARTESKPIRPALPAHLHMLSRAQFNRLTIEQKLDYLSRAHRNLQEVARRWGREPNSNEMKKKGPVSIS